MIKSEPTAERALTIAGFDPSGGAGVLADVRTFAAFGFQAVAAITSVTFQNTARVFGAIHQTGESVRAQVLPLLDDDAIICAKLGMLPTREVVFEVARLFQETDLPRPVVDPVTRSSSGRRLMEEEALAALIKELLPLARLVTPNIPEAETFTGITITSEADMRRAAAIIREMGAGAVLIKGGHLGDRKAEGGSRERGTYKAQEEFDEAIDVLDNEGKVTVFRERRVAGAELHGSGCILSSAIAAGLGKGMTLEDSVDAAKSFVFEAIRDSAPRS
ncbi:MAG TPA: bifunctional hydroxymethylpyrimidine kinase/phosphomethylpyrimidine kinase [Pyrinomonadaceae bacterium]